MSGSIPEPPTTPRAPQGGASCSPLIPRWCSTPTSGLSAISRCPRHWEHAIKAVVGETVSVVAEYDVVARSPSTTIRLPSVIALKGYQPAPRHIAFTRFNVFLRDRFRCQYCGERYRSTDLTFDHVIPRCDGGPTTWENIVAACWPCNMAQGRAARRKPLHTPRKPSARELMAFQREFPPELSSRDPGSTTSIGTRRSRPDEILRWPAPGKRLAAW